MPKILIVDDNKDTVGMVDALLRSNGYEVDSAFNGKEALDRLLQDANNNSLPDLVVLDMFMPLMSGREVCEQIRNTDALSDLKIVFFTVADFSDKGREMLQRLNISDYIVKPFHNDDFLNRIKNIL